MASRNVNHPDAKELYRYPAPVFLGPEVFLVKNNIDVDGGERMGNIQKLFLKGEKTAKKPFCGNQSFWRMSRDRRQVEIKTSKIEQKKKIRSEPLKK